jgi:hypothetical protein
MSYETMENTEVLPQKIVDRKIVILKSRLDTAHARLIGENNKTNFFIKHKFLKNQSTDISLIGFSKYFEPLIVIGGKYSIDYCKKQELKIECGYQAKKIFVGGEEVKLGPSDLGAPSRIIAFPTEEHYQYTNETYFVLDRFMREIAPEKIHFAPFECEQENEKTLNIDSRKVTISLVEEIAFLRDKIANRPPDADVLIKEIFEINERMIIYNPMYELVFQNARTAKTVTILIDAITGSMIDPKIDIPIPQKLPTPEKINRDISSVFKENLQELRVDESVKQKKQVSDIRKNVESEQENAPVVSAVESMFESEKAMALATDSLRRLGFKNKIMPLKVTSEGELFSVELNLQNKTAKVLVDTKMKEVKEYEIQELNV